MDNPSAASAGSSDMSATASLLAAASPVRPDDFYRALVEGTTEGILLRDAAGVITYASPQFADILGYSSDELVGTRAESLVDPEQRAAWLRALAAAAAGPQRFENNVIRKDGRVIAVSVSRRPLFDESGAYCGSLALVSDVTETRRAMSQLQQVAEATAAHTGQAFFAAAARFLSGALDLQAVFVTECMNFPTTRVRTLAYWRKGAPAENVEYDLAGTPCEITIRSGQPYCCPSGVQELFSVERGTGREGYVGLPFFDPDGRVIGHLALFREQPLDPSVADHPLVRIVCARAEAELQRKRAEEQARHHLEQLAHVTRLSSMGEMASAIAHELNQPLAAIVTFNQACMRLLRTGQASTEEITETMERVAAQAQRASQIIKHLRSFVRKDEAEPLPVQIGALVQAVVQLAQTEARQAGVVLQTDLADDLPDVLADDIQIEQVLLNLVRNAVDAINAAGSERRVVNITTRGAPGGVEVWVDDSGPGFDAATGERLFEPFFTTKAQGMGIGLAISRSIVEAHHGRIEAISTPGSGARFRIVLPAEGGGA
jgi:PAS domain S-box-containing protein